MLSELDRELLKELSLLERFNLDQAVAISSQVDVAVRILKMAADGQYVFKENQKEFSINSSVKETLRFELAENKKAFISQAHLCANVMIETDSPLQSIELYSLSGETKKAAEVAMKHVPQIVSRGDIEMLNKWSPAIAKLMGEGRNLERIFSIFGNLSIGMNDQAKALIRELTGLEGKSDFVSFELEIAKISTHFIYGNFEELHCATIDLLKRPRVKFEGHSHSLLTAVRPALIACMLTMNRVRFYEIYDEIESELNDVETDYMRVRINSVRAMKNFLDGNYIVANEFALAAIEIADEMGAKGGFMAYEAAYIVADTALEFGMEEISQKYAEDYLAHALAYHQYPWIAGFYARLSTIKLQNGELQAAFKLIMDGREQLEHVILNARILFLLDVAELVVQLNQGNFERVVELANRLPENDQIKQYKLIMSLWQNPKVAISRLNEMETPTIQLEFHKEMLLASFNLDSPKIAMKHLRNSLKIAEPNGYFRAYLLMPEPIRMHMIEIANENPTPYLNRISKAIREQSQELVKKASSGAGSLTKREIDILRRLETGLPISKIASSVNISQNTIKTHLKNLYRKLNVESRKEAVDRGKELMLL